jgi:hypothetical protein
VQGGKVDEIELRSQPDRENTTRENVAAEVVIHSLLVCGAPPDGRKDQPGAGERESSAGRQLRDPIHDSTNFFHAAPLHETGTTSPAKY